MVIRRKIGNISPLRREDTRLLDKCKSLLHNCNIIKVKKKKNKEKGTYYLLILEDTANYFYLTITKSPKKGIYYIIPSESTCEITIFEQDGKNLKDVIRKIKEGLNLADPEGLLDKL